MDDEVILKQTQKKRLVIDDDQEGPPTRTITTKVQEEKPARDNYDHKTNGDKAKDAKKPPEKKEETKTSKSDPKASPAKPKPASDKDPKAVKSNTDQKPPAKPKPASSTDEKKSGESNGQTQKKPSEGSKPPAKPVNKKKEESESESGSDEDSAEDSDSDDDRKKKEKAKPKPKPKPEVKPKRESKEEPKKVVKKKDVLVYDVLKRWWYALPEWPPAGHDYSAELAKNKLRKVDPKYFRKEVETDANGHRKVFEMPAYAGLFKDSSGEIHDLRPRESCPCYEVFKNKSILELCGLLATALKNQVEALEKSPVVDQELLHQLKKELVQAQKSYEAQKAKQQG